MWVEASGYAELFSFVVVHHALDPYFAARAPYLVADVKLAEGPHMTTTLVDCLPSDAHNRRFVESSVRKGERRFLPACFSTCVRESEIDDERLGLTGRGVGNRQACTVVVAERKVDESLAGGAGCKAATSDRLRGEQGPRGFDVAE